MCSRQASAFQRTKIRTVMQENLEKLGAPSCHIKERVFHVKLNENLSEIFSRDGRCFHLVFLKDQSTNKIGLDKGDAAEMWKDTSY